MKIIDASNDNGIVTAHGLNILSRMMLRIVIIVAISVNHLELNIYKVMLSF